jgi:phage FluMu protein Com
MTELRCSKCHKLLCKYDGGIIEVQCPRCKEMNSYNNNKIKKYESNGLKFIEESGRLYVCDNNWAKIKLLPLDEAVEI